MGEWTLVGVHQEVTGSCRFFSGPVEWKGKGEARVCIEGRRAVLNEWPCHAGALCRCCADSEQEAAS